MESSASVFATDLNGGFREIHAVNRMSEFIKLLSQPAFTATCIENAMPFTDKPSIKNRRQQAKAMGVKGFIAMDRQSSVTARLPLVCLLMPFIPVISGV